MSFLDRIREANTHDLSGFLPFRVGGAQVGLIRHRFAETLARCWPRVFRVDERGVELTRELDGPHVSLEQRSASVGEVLLALREEGVITGWRDEPYRVNRFFAEPPCLLLERAAVPFFGVCGYGVHLNGFVRSDNGLKMWVGRRALDKSISPGKLDQLVAGGQPFGIGLRQNMLKECREEAAIPSRLAEGMVPVGAITYCAEVPQGLRPDVIFNFDLELPADFKPVNTDGEVEAFYLWPVERVMEVIRETTDFKYNCALVVIDFLIRHGLIPPEHPDYVTILAGLRGREKALSGMMEGSPA